MTETRAATKPSIVGLISDTHGLLRPEAIEALKGSALILHAGDIGNPEILQGLAKIAPVVAVRGNNDRGAWAESLPLYDVIDVSGVFIYMLHDIHELDISPSGAGFRVVISGHSHKPLIEEKRGVLYVNPGSAGPRRFKLPISVARLHVDESGAVEARIIELSVGAASKAARGQSAR